MNERVELKELLCLLFTVERIIVVVVDTFSFRLYLEDLTSAGCRLTVTTEAALSSLH